MRESTNSAAFYKIMHVSHNLLFREARGDYTHPFTEIINVCLPVPEKEREHGEFSFSLSFFFTPGDLLPNDFPRSDTNDFSSYVIG